MADKGDAKRLTRETLGEAEDDPRVVSAVKEYLALLEAGETPSRQSFLGRHAEIAHALEACLDGLELVHGAANGVRGADSPAWKSLAAGQPAMLGDYRILREIGRGGMGIVYEALHLPLSRRVALKMLPAVSSFDGLRLQRFKIEAQAAARLQHPNIVQVYAVGSERDIHYYAMQLIDGYPLSAIVSQLRQATGKSVAEGDDSDSTATGVDERGHAQRRQIRTRGGADDSTDRRFTARTATDGVIAHAGTESIDGLPLTKSYPHRLDYFRNVVRLMQQAAAALEHAHQCGVIHRDIKPANLLVDAQGHLWVADFGLARISSDVHLTRTGNPLGTLRYMSPEQAGGVRGLMDHRTDVYSLGVTLYELLTLEPAIPGGESHTLLRKVVEDEPRPPRIHDQTIPLELETIVLKAASKLPEERYASAQQFADDMQRWLDDEPILARPPGVWERAAKWRRRHRMLVRVAAIFAGLAMCGLLLATLLIAQAYRRETIQRKAAEASFAQARRAVDAFSELGETELAAKPELRDVRRRLLETSLGYYREFTAEHGNDPAAMEGLSSASQRIERLVDELRILDGSAPLLLMSDERVQADLRLSDSQREQVDVLLARLEKDRIEGEFNPRDASQNTQHRLVKLLESHEAAISSALNTTQQERLRQIARQQRAPFVFRSPEVIEALNLTGEQRRQVNTIIEEERMDGGGRQQASRGDGPPPDRSPDGFRPGDPGGLRGRGGPDGAPPPREFDEYEAWLAEQETGDPPPPRDGNGRPGPPPERRGRGGPPRPRDEAEPERGPGGMAANKKRTTARILTILTPEQRATWERLVGKPFEYDLNWGPDDVLPR